MIALPGEYGGDQRALAVVWVSDVRNVCGLVGLGAVGVEHDGSRPEQFGAARVGAVGAGSRCALACSADRLVLDVIEIHAAGRGTESASSACPEAEAVSWAAKVAASREAILKGGS